MQPGSWKQDPTGRFGYRWHDGTDWTDIVVGANGQQTTDPFPREPQTALPPPSPATATDATWQPPGQGGTLPAVARSPWEPQPSSGDTEWDVPSSPVPPRTVSTAPASVASSAWRTQVAMAPTPKGIPAARSADRFIVAIVIAVIGIVATALSLFILDWAGGAGFLDARDGASSLDGSVLDTILEFSLQWGSFVVFGVTVVLTAIVLLTDRSRGWRTAAAFAAGIGMVLHVYTIVRLFRGAGDPEIGAWLGAVGYLVVLVGLGADAVKRGE
jgi:hypothetical protein